MNSLRIPIGLVALSLLLGLASERHSKPAAETGRPMQLAQEIYGGAVGEGDGPIGGPMAYGAPVGSPPLNSPMLYGEPVGSPPLNSPMLYGEPAGMGAGPLNSPMLYGAPVGSGGDNAPIGGAPLY
jgi:hypothetical protein